MRRLAALLVGLLATGALLVAGAPPAAAHAALITTDPLDRSIVQRSPAEVTLVYGEPVGVGLGALKVLSDQGVRVDTGKVTRSHGDTRVHLALQPDLPTGTYVVVWRVISADSHPVSGAFTFVVRKPSRDPAQLLGRGNLTKLTASPRAPGIALGVTRFAGFAAQVVLLGASLFCLLLWPIGLRRLRWLLVGAAGLELLAALAAVALDGPYAAGLALSHAFDGDLLRSVLHTRYGEATAARAVLALLAIPLVWVPRARLASGLLALVGVGWSITWGLAGHAAVGKWEPWSLLADISHLVAVSAWVGGLVVVSFGLRRLWSVDDRRVLRGWSKLAATSVAVLIGTGVLASLRQVGSWDALFSTQYGVRLLIKIGLVALMLLLALVGRSFVRRHYSSVPNEPSAQQLTRVRRGVAAEASVAGLVLAVTALLVNTTPAAAEFAPPYTGISQAGPISVHADIYPARRGVNGLHIYTVGSKGLTVDVPFVSAYLTDAKGLRITAYAQHKSLGHWEYLYLVLPHKGTWTIHVDVQITDVDSYSTEQTMRIR